MWKQILSVLATEIVSKTNTATANVINLQITISWAKNKVKIWP